MTTDVTTGPASDPGAVPGASSVTHHDSAPTRRAGYSRRTLDRPVVALVPALVTLGLCILGIGERDVWRDEAASWWAAHLSWDGLLRLVGHTDVVLLPYYVVLHEWTAIAGSSPVALRVPSALAMAASAGLVGLLGRRMAAPAVGLVAGLLFAVLPAVTRYGQEARPYAFTMLAALLATSTLLTAIERGTRRHWVWYAVAVAATGACNLVALLLLAAHFAHVVANHRTRLIQFGVAVALSLLAVLPLVVLGRGQIAQIAWNQTSFEDLIHLPNELFGFWLVGDLIVVLGVWGMFRVGRYAPLLVTWAVAPPVLTFVTAPVAHLFLGRYLLFTLPAWALLAAAAIVPRRGRRRIRVLGTVAVLGVAVASLPGALEVRGPLADEADFRAAAALIGASHRSGDGVVFDAVGMGTESVVERLPVAYEWRDLAGAPREVFTAVSAEESGEYVTTNCADPAICSAAVEGTDRVWLVTTRPDGALFDGQGSATAAVLRSEFRVESVTSVAGATVALLLRR